MGTQIAKQGYVLANGNGTYAYSADLPDGIFWDEIPISEVPENVDLAEIDSEITSSFDAEKAINRMMELLGPIRMIQLAPYHFMICDSVRKKAFSVLNESLDGLKQLNIISQDDYELVCSALSEQNINLKSF